MKLTDFKIKTEKGEVIKLEEISMLSFGIMTDDRFNAETKDLFISCKQGHLRFSLDEITEISLNLDKEKSFIHITSWWGKKEEEDHEDEEKR